jgi:hypothetical protein
MTFFWVWYHVDSSVDANILEKHWHLPTSLHGAKTQNNTIIMLTAIETSNLTLTFAQLCNADRPIAYLISTWSDV